MEFVDAGPFDASPELTERIKFIDRPEEHNKRLGAIFLAVV